MTQRPDTVAEQTDGDLVVREVENSDGWVKSSVAVDIEN